MEDVNLRSQAKFNVWKWEWVSPLRATAPGNEWELEAKHRGHYTIKPSNYDTAEWYHVSQTHNRLIWASRVCRFLIKPNAGWPAGWQEEIVPWDK